MSGLLSCGLCVYGLRSTSLCFGSKNKAETAQSHLSKSCPRTTFPVMTSHHAERMRYIFHQVRRAKEAPSQHRFFLCADETGGGEPTITDRPSDSVFACTRSCACGS